MEIEYTSNRFMTYRNLMKKIQSLLYASWGADKVRFSSAYPKITETDNISPPIITYKVISKTPGKFGPSNTVEKKPRVRETIKIKDKNGNDVPVDFLGQVFDYEILFEMWDEDGDKADELAERFQQFMTLYTGYLKKMGVEALFFNSMQDDDDKTKWKTDLIKRNVSYFIRMDEVVGVTSPVIDNIDIGSIVYDNIYNMILNVYLLGSDPERENLYEIRGSVSQQ
jgi:hypothetical protein